MNNKSNYSEIFVAQRIKQLRLAKKLTQKAFAVSLGIVQGYLSGIEQGKKIPSYTLLMAICHIHGVSEEWLFGGTDGEPAGKPQPREVLPERKEGGIPLLNSIPLDFPAGFSERVFTDFILFPGKIPSYTLLMAICHIHGVSEEWLFGGTDGEPAGKPQPREVLPERKEGGIPLLNSIPLDFPAGCSERVVTDFILLPGNHEGCFEGCFATTAVGDFMAPTIRDGDLVIFKPGGEIGNRSIVLMTNKWGEVILRRYRIAGNEEYFSPENTAYAPFKADANTKIFGTVIDIWRRVKL